MPNRRMRKTACPVVWEGHGAKSPRLDPIISNAFRFFRRKEAGVFLVEFKEEGDAFGFGFKIGFAVGGINGAVEGLMGFKKHRWSRLEKNIQ